MDLSGLPLKTSGASGLYLFFVELSIGTSNSWCDGHMDPGHGPKKRAYAKPAFGLVFFGVH